MNLSGISLFLSLAVGPATDAGALAGRDAGFAAEARQAALQRNFEKAAPLYQMALKLDPSDVRSRFDYAGTLEQLGKKDEALEQYQKTIAAAPTFAEAWNQLGVLFLLHKKEPHRAIDAFKSALQIKDGHADPRFPKGSTRPKVLRNLAVAYGELKRPGLAAGIARSALADPSLRRSEDDERILKILKTETEKELQPALQRPKKKAIDSAKNVAALEKLLATELSDFDEWHALHKKAQLLEKANQMAEAVAAFHAAAKAAEGLPYAQWQESLFEAGRVAFRQEGGEAALAGALRQLCFVDAVTVADPERKGRGPYLQLAKALRPLLPFTRSPGWRELTAECGAFSAP